MHVQAHGSPNDKSFETFKHHGEMELASAPFNSKPNTKIENGFAAEEKCTHWSLVVHVSYPVFRESEYIEES